MKIPRPSADRAFGCLVHGSLGGAAILLAVGLLLALASPRPPARPVVVAGPESVLVEAGSVEARLQTLERQLVELRAEFDAHNKSGEK